jgi:hypothetical protein
MGTHADGYAERDAALLLLAKKQQGRSRRITVSADKAYDTKDLVGTVRELARCGNWHGAGTECDAARY